MRRFKIGERVVVYDSRLSGLRQVGVIDSFDPNGNAPGSVCVSGVVRKDEHKQVNELIVHPKQCRHIRRRPSIRQLAAQYWLDHTDKIYRENLHISGPVMDAFVAGVKVGKRM